MKQEKSSSQHKDAQQARLDASVAHVSKAQLNRLKDPQACKECHPGHYDEWAGSMHAYAAMDPVFVAMNQRGQEETKGALGTFCVQCHAPMAVSDGLTTDGLNLEQLDEAYQGVTCYFCHSVESVEGEHNNPLKLGQAGTLRGPFTDPQGTSGHLSAYSKFLDSKTTQSAQLCGACHDVTLEAPLVEEELALERTFAEWKESWFNRSHTQGGLSCGGCHMRRSPRRTRSAEVDGAPMRSSMRHDFEGVDLALTDFPGKERQRVLTERFLDASLLAEICVAETGAIEVTLENNAAHSWPSGAALDRRAWLEVKAYAEDGTLVYETLDPELQQTEDAELTGDAGMLAGAKRRDDAGMSALVKLQADAGALADAGIIRALSTVSEVAPVLSDVVLGKGGDVAHMFWDVAEIAQSNLIPGVATLDPLDPLYHRQRQRWLFNERRLVLGISQVTLRVRVRPISLEVLSDLVGSGHLERQYLESMPVQDVLPNRCYSEDVLNRFSDIIPSGVGSCENTLKSDSTLVWDSQRAQPETPEFRENVVQGAPARCLSHPTYVRVPMQQ